jgi:hypothetical protein
MSLESEEALARFILEIFSTFNEKIIPKIDLKYLIIQQETMIYEYEKLL